MINDRVQLQVPPLLVALIAESKWTPQDPRPSEVVDLGKAMAHRLSAEDHHLILMPPPFHTIEDEVLGGNDFWKFGVTNSEEIDYAMALIIADFGPGSDSPIVLYYGESGAPTVMYLRWVGNGMDVRHEWVRTHDSFAYFAKDVGLT